MNEFFFFLFVFLDMPHGMQNFSTRPGMEPMPLAVEAWRLNRWTAREVPELDFFFYRFSFSRPLIFLIFIL